MGTGVNGSSERDGEVYWRDKAVRHRLGFALEHDRVYADVVFVVGKDEERIPAHKLILRLSSLVFENLIASHEEQGLQEIKLPNPSPSIFKRLLKFIYTDELEMYDFITFLKVARDFGFQRLAELSIETLKKTEITPVNAVFMLDIAKGVGDSDLEDISLLFILKNAEDIFSTKTFLLMSYVSLCQILLDERLACDELNIFKAVMRWAKFQCRKSNIPETADNIRDILKDARLLIRYTCIKYDEFLQEVKPSGVLDSKEYVQVLKLFADSSSNPLNIQIKPRSSQHDINSNNDDLSYSRRTNSHAEVYPVRPPSLSPLPVPPPTQSISGYPDPYQRSTVSNSFEYSQPVIQEYSGPPNMQLGQTSQIQPVRPEPTDANEFQLKNCTVDFNDLINAVQLQYSIQKLVFNEVVFQNFGIVNGTRVFLPNLQVFHYFQQKDLLSKLPDKSFLNGMSLKDFLFFEKNEGATWVYSDLWTLGVEICIDVKGLRLIEINPREQKLVLSYPEQLEVDEILRGLKQQTNITQVCLTACSVTSIIQQIKTRSWEKLVLQGVIFEASKLHIFNKCSSLRYLSIFATDGSSINLETDLKNQRIFLLRLSLTKATIGGWGPNTPIVPFSSLEELYLDVCVWDSGFAEKVHRIFPNLKRIAVRSKDACRVSSRFIANILEIKSLEKISIFRYPGGEDTHCNPNIDIFLPPVQGKNSVKLAVKSFLQKCGMQFPDNYVMDFILIKTSSAPLRWKAIFDERDLDEIHFQYSMLNEFFVDSSASKMVE